MCFVNLILLGQTLCALHRKLSNDQLLEITLTLDSTWHKVYQGK